LVVSVPDTTGCFGSQYELSPSQEITRDLKIETQYDKSTRMTRSILHSIPVPTLDTSEFNHLYVNAAVDYYGRGPSIPETVKIGFDSRPCHMSDKSEPDVTIWADGRLVYSGKLQRLFCDGGIRRESEFGTIDVPFVGFTRVAEAIKVEVQIGEHQFVLSENAKEGFRKLAQFVSGS
jgi:hypothetical protein